MEKIINFFLRRPILVILLTIFLILLGIKSYLSLHIEANPEITSPVIYAAIPYPGAPSEEVEEKIAYPLEEKLKEIEEIEELTTLSWENVCVVVAFFKPKSNTEKASELFKNIVRDFKNKFPEIMEPQIEEVSFSNLPLMFIGLAGDNEEELNKKANLIKTELQKLEGIREVILTGNSEEEILIQVDAEKLKEKDFFLLKDLVEKLNQQNINFPGGKFVLEGREWSVRILGKFRKIKDLENLPLKEGILLRDIAEVKKITGTPKTIVRVQGEKGITLGILKKDGYGTIETCEKIKKCLKKYRDVVIISDQSEILKIQMRELKIHALIGAFLVLFILFVVLGKRSAIIVSIALPLSILMTFICMYFKKMTLNMVSLFALVLTLGMVVDNAIVVCENIYRHLSMGENSHNASFAGTREVIWPIFSSTLTVLAAFVPLLILSGVVGEYISPIPHIVSYAILSSLLVAIIFTPTLAKVFLKVERIERKKFVESLRDSYRKILNWSLEHSFIILISAIIIFILALKAIPLIGVEMFPKIEASRVYLDIKTPPSTTRENTERVVKNIEEILVKSNTVEKYFSNIGSTGQRINIDDYFYIGSNRARIILDFKKNLKKSYSTIITELRNKIKKIYPEVEIDFQEKRLGIPTGTPISIKILGNDLEELKNLRDLIISKLKSIKGVVDIKDNYPPDVPEIQIKVKHQKLGKLGLTTKDFGSFIFLTLQGYKIGEMELKEGDILKKLPIFLKINLSENKDIANFQNAFFETKKGEKILFSEIAKIRPTTGIGEITHEYGVRCINITANVTKGQIPSKVIEKLKKEISKIKIPPDLRIKYEGENKMLERAFTDLKRALLISLILIYIILLIEFRSSLQPLIILTCVPYALVGVILGLIITKNPFGVLSFIGIICLSGVVVNNAIIMIDYINNLRRNGVSKKEAILQATQIRIRPILITKITIILGVLPLATGIGETGTSHIWAPLAFSLIWGLIVATTLTLIIIPVVYNLIEDLKNKVRI
jgi:multidrug efflux pump subunit AcrB